MPWSDSPDSIPRARDVFCNRTLNLRSIRAVGYDMDYTLVHYQVEAWELRAYEYTRTRLAEQGWPVEGFRFDPDLVSRGLIIDTELGNLVKADRFGYVKKVLHGTRSIDFDEQRRVYSRIVIDLAQDRWAFLNTLFSLSEACLYAQLVDLLDAKQLPEVLGYTDLFRRIRVVLDATHMEGQLKAEIAAAPERYVFHDPETALALLDQRHSGKKLMLITNSEWDYTRSMMAYAFDRLLPKGQTWRDLFDVVIVEAGKPDFFLSRRPLFEVVSEDGMLRPTTRGLREGGVFLGGHAALVEKHLGVTGDEILYVGDHMWGDVRVSKSVLRWRTALILRELEGEISALEAFAGEQQKLEQLMDEKEELERRVRTLRLQVQRQSQGYGPVVERSTEDLGLEIGELRHRISALDEAITPLVVAAGEVGHKLWGPLMRAGNDKSHLARQVERYADIYTSRVSNLVFLTPFAYLRSARGSLPHDPQ